MLRDKLRRMSHDIGFADEHAERGLRGVHRAVFGMGNNVGAAMQGVDQIIDKGLVLSNY
jgi:hypothetical protein